MRMNISEIISKKRDGNSLSPDEISFAVREFTAERISDAQMAALAMAICIKDMNPEETACLTFEMLSSGETMHWPADSRPMVDKHSTGGIGDKVSLILAPLLACCGLSVPMISGRGLGPTGGTLDKLESIPGFNAELPLDEIRSIVEDFGCVITAASKTLAPADRKLYRLRDITGTVKSVPLITSSIMSKKLAEGLNALVLDVKCGTGAFMKSPEEATALAQSLVGTGKSMNVKTSALITDMNQPLGRMVGNAVEVNESMAALRGEGPKDLMEVTLALGGELMRLAGVAEDSNAGIATLAVKVSSGAGYEKFRHMIAAQGGDPDAKLAVADASEVLAEQAGFVSGIDAEQLGMAIIEMKGGRKQQGDKLDHSVGLEMLVRIGDKVEPSQPLVNLFAPDAMRKKIGEMIQSAIEFSDSPVAEPKLIIDKVT